MMFLYVPPQRGLMLLFGLLTLTFLLLTLDEFGAAWGNSAPMRHRHGPGRLVQRPRRAARFRQVPPGSARGAEKLGQWTRRRAPCWTPSRWTPQASQEALLARGVPPGSG